MQTISLPKVDGSSTQPAAEMNSVFNELMNFILGADLSLDGANLNQLGIALAIYAAGSDYYVDSGAANAYVLSVVGSKKAPNAYFDGMRVRFIATNANTNASTINIAGIGVKNIKMDLSGTATPANSIIPGEVTELVYTTTSPGFFVLAQQKLFYGAKVVKTSDQTITAGSTDLVTFDTVDSDNYSLWNSGSNLFTIAKPGRYRIAVKVVGTMTDGVGGSNIQIPELHLYVNGSLKEVFSVLTLGRSSPDTPPIDYIGTYSPSTSFKFSATDTISLKLYNNDTTHGSGNHDFVMNGNWKSSFEIEYLGR